LSGIGFTSTSAFEKIGLRRWHPDKLLKSIR